MPCPFRKRSLGTVVKLRGHVAACLFRKIAFTLLRKSVYVSIHMKAREVVQRLRARGCEERKGKGSHRVFTFGACRTTVSIHRGKDIKRGTLRGIERDMEPEFGPGWLTGTGEEKE